MDLFVIYQLSKLEEDQEENNFKNKIARDAYSSIYELNESNEIEALFKLNINEFRNKRSVQLFISDAKNILRDENGKIISKNKKKQEQYDEMNQDNQYDDSNQDVYVDK